MAARADAAPTKQFLAGLVLQPATPTSRFFLPAHISGTVLLQVKWGIDLASEHERYLTEEVFRWALPKCIQLPAKREF